MAEMPSSGEASLLIGSYALRLPGRVRLVLGFLVLCGAMVSLVGTAWDIQWHVTIGRDRTLLAPHIMILSGFFLSGLAALGAVLIETMWTRHHRMLAVSSTSFAGVFQSSSGSYLAGYAALSAAIAFPLDAYWHALYGVDVAIWAPFHVMELASGALIALGAAFMLIAASRLAERAADGRTLRLGYRGAIVALATMLSLLTILLSDSLQGRGFVMIGTIMQGWNMFSLFPPLSCLLVALVLLTATSAIGYKGVATAVVLVYGCLALFFCAFVPPAMRYLVGLEHLSYRAHPVVSLLGAHTDLSQLSVIAVNSWPLAPLLVAPLLDYVVGRARRKGWSRRRMFLVAAASTWMASIPLLATSPWALGDMIVVLGMSGRVTILGLGGLLVSLVLGLCGAVLGAWSGRRLGASVEP